MAGDKDSGILRNTEYVFSDKIVFGNRRTMVFLWLAYCTISQSINHFNQVILRFIEGHRIAGRGCGEVI